MQACSWPQAAVCLGLTAVDPLTGKSLSRVNCEEFVHYQVRANETNSEANIMQFSVRNKYVLMKPCPRISGGPLLSLLCSASVRHCLQLLAGVVDCCATVRVGW